MAKLKRKIGWFTILFLSLNAILGTELFFIPGITAAYAGPASLLAWIGMSIIALFISFYFAELVSMFPSAGGGYNYVKHAFGDFHAFIVGWMSWIVANVTIAISMVGAFYVFFPRNSVFIPIYSLIIILLFNYINLRGIETSGKLLLFFGFLSILLPVVLSAVGILSVNLSNLSPFFVFPFTSIFVALFYVSDVFFGWEATTFLAEEVKNARKILPKALIWSTVIIAVLSIGLVFVSLTVVDWQTLSLQHSPFSFLGSVIFGEWGGRIISILMFLPLIGTAAAWIVASPRLMFAMSREGALIPSFQKIHKKYKTPYVAIYAQTVLSIIALFVGFASYEVLLSILLPLTIISYVFILLSVTKLRIERPEIKRYFKAPFGKLGPVIIVIFILGMLYFWVEEVRYAFTSLIIDFGFILFGVPLYALIKLQTDKKFSERFIDGISWFWDKLFPLWYDKDEIQKIVKKLAPKKGQKILDFGCATGETTLELSKKVGETGKVIAVDISRKQLERAMKKANKSFDISNIIFVKEEERLPLKKHSFNGIVAVGVFGHFKNPRKRLKELFALLKPGGRFSFLSFGKSLGIPPVEFLKSEKNIKEVFKGLNVDFKIERKEERFVEYWFIWGRKRKQTRKK
jgi:amino acid transporter/protein-L-isoaspartate O-methyltransferase